MATHAITQSTNLVIELIDDRRGQSIGVATGTARGRRIMAKRGASPRNAGIFMAAHTITGAAFTVVEIIHDSCGPTTSMATNAARGSRRMVEVSTGPSSACTAGVARNTISCAAFAMIEIVYDSSGALSAMTITARTWHRAMTEISARPSGTNILAMAENAITLAVGCMAEGVYYSSGAGAGVTSGTAREGIRVSKTPVQPVYTRAGGVTAHAITHTATLVIERINHCCGSSGRVAIRATGWSGGMIKYCESTKPQAFAVARNTIGAISMN